jgi:hypothetical protein
MTVSKRDASRQRQRLREAYEELGGLLEAFYSRVTVFRGSVHERSVRCGNPTCHCAREGDKGHPSCSVTYRDGDRQRNRILPVEDRARVKEMVEAFRRARAAHRKWREIVREIDMIIEALLESRSVQYVPGGEESS